MDKLTIHHPINRSLLRDAYIVDGAEGAQ